MNISRSARAAGIFVLFVTMGTLTGVTHAVDGRDGVVYVVSNDPVPNGNAILAYRRDDAGSLTPLLGSPFPTSGKGYATNIALPHFGPFDLDQNIVVDRERTRLFATNGGSDTIAVFDGES